MGTTPGSPESQASLADFHVEALDAIKTTTGEDLDKLKEEIRVGLHNNMYVVLQYCETNRVDYFTSWKTDAVKPDGDVQKEHFRVAMELLMPPDQAETFIKKLKNKDKDAEAMLDVIVHFLKERKERRAGAVVQ